MKYLITGITGFTGTNLAKFLIGKNEEVHGLVRSGNGRNTEMLDVLDNNEYNKINFIVGDLKNYYGISQIIDKNEYDGVFHLAAFAHPPSSFTNPILTFEENVMASVNLITCLQNTPTRLMYCSTSEVYGNTCKTNGILNETDKLIPNNPYGVTKAAIDMYMQERMNNKFINGFITRAFSNTGPKRGNNYSISSDAFQIAKMVLGQQDKVLRIGNLKTKRAVIDVRDVCNAYYLLMKNYDSNGGVFNICGDDVREMQHYTDLLIKQSGIPYADIEQRIDKKLYRPIDIEIQIGNSNELKQLTNWEPKISIEQTMTDLLNYWLKKLEK